MKTVVKIFRASLLSAGLLLAMWGFCPLVSAAEDEDIYTRQGEVTGASEILSSLPEETKRELTSLGIDLTDGRSVTELSLGEVFASMLDSAKDSAGQPMSAAAVCMAMIMLIALAQGTDIRLGRGTLSGVSGAVGAVCICSVLSLPLCSLASRCAELISGACGFMLCYIPVLSGLLACSGSGAAAASYYTSLTAAAGFAGTVADKAVVPLTNVFLALSLGAAMSTGLKLSPLCTSVYKLCVRLLTLVMGVFSAVLSAQTLVTSSVDAVSRRTLRFAVGSFVPVVGGVLSETISTFGGSLELLRRGAGVLVMIAAAALLMPLLMECMVWQLCFFLITTASRLLSLEPLSRALDGAASAVRLLTALLLSMLVLFIISTVTVIIAGGGM